jgi:putative peptidoglycan lipid II flippase
VTKAEGEEARVAKRAGVVGAATMLSRVTGLARDQVMANLFGAGFVTDAFNVAFRIPNLLRDLFAEGAMSSAFVPTFTEAHLKRGDEAAWALGRQVMAWLAVVLSVICVLGGLFAGPVVRLFAGGFERVPGKLELTVLLTRVMLPFLPLVALAAAAMGMLNARGRFGVPALAPVLLNLGMIFGGLALIPVMGAIGQPPILAMALGVVLGGALQWGFQLPSLHRLGFRLRPELPRRDPGVRRVASLMLPATVGLAATQLNVTVSTVIASHLEQGSVSWLYYAFRLMQLPIGVFGVALGTVSMPELARAAVQQDMPALKRTLSATLRLVFLLTVPAAVWLASMAAPLIALLFEHGRFHAGDTRQTAGALVMYSIGLPAFAAVGVLTRTFYALGETRVPVQASFVSVALNLTLNLLFIGPLRFLGLGHMGLALATSVTSIGSLLQLAYYLRRRVGPLEGRRMLRTLGGVLLASLGVAALCEGLLAVLGSRWHHGFVPEALTVIGGVVIAIAAGYALMKLLRVEEVSVAERLVQSLRRRITGR